MTLLMDTYSNVLATLASYSAKDTLTDFWPLAVKLFEAKANRTLFCKDMEQRSTTTVDLNSSEPEFISLPSDFQTMRDVRLSSYTGKPRLTYLVKSAMDEWRTNTGNSSNRPLWFTIVGSEMEMLPTPDSAYTVEMTYRKLIPNLQDNSTNWLLTSHPDAYLYGCLLEAEPYMKNDQRIAVWTQGLSAVIDQINGLSMQSQFNAGPLQMMVSGSPTP